MVQYSRQLAHLAGQFSESYLDIGESPSSIVKFTNRIIHRIRHGIPTSMIRLGDGEGHFLEYPPELFQWRNLDREACQQGWWGEVKLDPNDMQRLTGLFFDAVSNADILGVPDLPRWVRSMSSFDSGARSFEQRGLMAIFHHLGSRHYLNAKLPTSILTSCHYHTDMELWDIYRYLLTGVQKLTVISCHERIQDVVADRGSVFRRSISY